MKYFLTLFLLISFDLANAQVLGKFFYNKQWELTTRENAVFIRMCIYDTTNHYFAGAITDMYLSGKPQMKGFYRAMKKEGDFTFFYENGNVESVGKFVKDSRFGYWKYYYSDGKEKMEIEYGMPTKIHSLNDSTGHPLVKDGTGKWIEIYEEYNVGKIIVTGELKHFERDGEWTCQLASGQLLYKETFKNGSFRTGSEYQDGKKTKSNSAHSNVLILPFKFIVTEAFAAAEGINFKTYPFLMYMQHGESVVRKLPEHITTDAEEAKTFTIVENPAVPPEGMAGVYKFLGEKMQYPAAARRMGIDGIVTLEFVVNKDGSLSEFKIVKGIGGGCEQEAIRVLKEYALKHKWTPATHRGKPVQMRMIIPVTFHLG